jgi:hypothetical protein
MAMLTKIICPVLRAETGSYDEAGDYTTTRTTLNISMNVQPNKPTFQEVMADPKLLSRDKWASVKIFSDEQLFEIENSPSRKADIVVFNSKMYEIKSSSGLREGITIQHYEYTADFKAVVDDGDGEIMVGDPFQAQPYEKWISITGTINSINTTFILAEKIKTGSLIIYIGSVPRVFGDFTVADDGITVTLNTAPKTGATIKARGTPTNVQ